MTSIRSSSLQKILAAFPHLRHAAPFKILENGKWKHASGLLHWELLKGDFRDCIEAASIPDLIFYDPFSSKADSCTCGPPRSFRAFFNTARQSPPNSTPIQLRLRYEWRYWQPGFLSPKGSAPDPSRTPLSHSQERQELESIPSLHDS